VFELDDRFLNRDATQSELVRDLIAIDPIPRPQLASQHQVDDVGNNLVLLFYSIPLRHCGDS
jgi:hypothetical protein